MTVKKCLQLYTRLLPVTRVLHLLNEAISIPRESPPHPQNETLLIILCVILWLLASRRSFTNDVYAAHRV
jgi:hypothetical protein